MHETRKLAEAEYFLGRMVALHNTREEFVWNLSAFLTAARTVAQYARKEAASKPKGLKWYDAAERILPVMAPLKDGVVVELGIGGRSEFAPMLYKRLHGGLGGHQRLGPRAGQATVQGDGIENFNADAPFERQPLDGVEAIELGAPGPSPEADEPPSGGWPFALLGSPNGAGAPHLPGLLAEHILALHAL